MTNYNLLLASCFPLLREPGFKSPTLLYYGIIIKRKKTLIFCIYTYPKEIIEQDYFYIYFLFWLFFSANRAGLLVLLREQIAFIFSTKVYKYDLKLCSSILKKKLCSSQILLLFKVLLYFISHVNVGSEEFKFQPNLASSACQPKPTLDCLFGPLLKVSPPFHEFRNNGLPVSAQIVSSLVIHLYRIIIGF